VVWDNRIGTSLEIGAKFFFAISNTATSAPFRVQTSSSTQLVRKLQPTLIYAYYHESMLKYDVRVTDGQIPKIISGCTIRI